MSGTLKPIKHGTIGGYMAHRRREQAACASCTSAWRMYYQNRNGALPRGARARQRAEEKHEQERIERRREQTRRAMRKHRAGKRLPEGEA